MIRGYFGKNCNLCDEIYKYTIVNLQFPSNFPTVKSGRGHILDQDKVFSKNKLFHAIP